MDGREIEKGWKCRFGLIGRSRLWLQNLEPVRATVPVLLWVVWSRGKEKREVVECDGE